MKLSAYCYLFNARIREFDLDGMVANFTAFFDETVVATIPSQDDTHERLLAYQHQFGADRFRVIMSNIDIAKNNRWDGDLKTVALSECSRSGYGGHPRCYVIMDGDERIPVCNRERWIELAEALHRAPYDGVLVPVLDLWGDERHIRANHPIGLKFRLHKDTIVRRGVIPEAELPNGLFDTSRSDSTEPLLANGQLGAFAPLRGWWWHPVYVLHYGHLDAERRVKLNREFWREHWKNRSGEEPKMALEADELANEPVVEHGLELP